MHNSIQQFAEFGINNMEKVVRNFLEDPKNFADLVYGLRDEALNLVINIISETLVATAQDSFILIAFAFNIGSRPF